MKFAQFLALSLVLGLLSLVFCNLAQAQSGQADPPQLAAAEDEDEEDEEEEAVNYRDKVREIQQWMNRRDSERKGEAPTLDVAPAPAYPRYYRGDDNGGGYRRLDREVRARLSDAPAASYTPRRHYRHYHYRSWHQRWHRHVRPVIQARRHHFRHGHHHYHSRHTANGWHRHQSHSVHPAAKHGPGAPSHGRGAPAHSAAAKSVPPAARHAAKAAHPAAVKAPARPAKAAPAKAAAPKKGRSKR